MPELPEVEVIRRGLAEHVVGRVIDSAEVLHPRAVRRHGPGPDDFADRIRGLTVAAARRRGKYLWLPLSSGTASMAGRPGAAGRGEESGPAGVWREPGADGAEDTLLAHLGMSGQMILSDPGRPLSAHVRARFTFADSGPDLRFTDQRTFGHLVVVRGGGVLPGLIAHIAPDPLEEAFDEAAVIAKLRARRTGVKTALLDQTLVSGIGNIYADEALWRARLHWARPAAALSRAQAARLLSAVREVLDEALLVGGTSFDRLYVNVNGESGYFGRSLAVYGREGEPCPRCGTPVLRERFMNRSAHSCPACQPRFRARRRPRPAPGRSATANRSV